MKKHEILVILSEISDLRALDKVSQFVPVSPRGEGWGSSLALVPPPPSPTRVSQPRGAWRARDRLHKQAGPETSTAWGFSVVFFKKKCMFSCWLSSVWGQGSTEHYI